MASLPSSPFTFQEVEKEVADDEAVAAPPGRTGRGGSAGAGNRKKKVIELEYVFDAEMEGEGQSPRWGSAGLGEMRGGASVQSVGSPGMDCPPSSLGLPAQPL